MSSIAPQHPNSDTYYHHLIFDNSLTEGGYFFSHTAVEAPSQLETADQKLPVSSARFFNPPNSLKLSWLSRTGGTWQAELHTETWLGRIHPLAGDHLSFWCSAEESIPGGSLPLISIKIEDGPQSVLLALSDFSHDLPANRWLQIKIPLPAFETDPGSLDFSRIEKVIFTQGSADETPHTLYLDEVKIIDGTAGGACKPPASLEARGYDCHIDLTWTDSGSPALAYYQIYRSADGENFLPIGIQNRSFTRYADYVGQVRAPFYYKISAVSYDYLESNFSEVVSAATRSLTDDELLDMVQSACYRHYWEGAHPEAGLALESVPGDENLVALGASGFGVLALVAAVERGFISRQAGIDRMLKIIRFLENADRFHGVWPHFLDGRTGRVIPLFGKYDNGGDLVETAFMVQGLLTARQYFDQSSEDEEQIRARITKLWEAVEWDWYRQSPDSDFLFWHWSPDYGWYIDHPLIGWNETMIVYLLAIASPTYPVPASMYYSGWASQTDRAVRYRQNWGQTNDGDHYANGKTYFGIPLPVAVSSGGPLFFTHYSFLGFDPRGRRDKFTNYFENNRAIALINQAYCIQNPGHYKEYSRSFWGLTASVDHTGYVAHEPSAMGDTGTITPTGALASYPYTPEESLGALKSFYYQYGRQIWGIFGFRDAYNPTFNYISNIFMGLNQAPITVMIENYRSGLLWKRFMSNPEIPAMLERIGFSLDNPWLIS